MSESLAFLIDAIEKADSATALTESVENLANAGRIEAIPTLTEALSYNNPGAAVAAVEGLIQLGEPVVPKLLEQIDQNNYTARSWAIRALAGIGDPRGLVTLLGAATADFSMSVRRAAARGLGNMQWHRFPPKFLEVAQAEALDALLFVAQHDEEWVVRYAAVVGLEALGLEIQSTSLVGQIEIQDLFGFMATHETSLAVRARVSQARQRLGETAVTNETVANETVVNSEHQASDIDWEKILKDLYERKFKERELIAAGDPTYYRQLVQATLTQNA